MHLWNYYTETPLLDLLVAAIGVITCLMLAFAWHDVVSSGWRAVRSPRRFKFRLFDLFLITGGCAVLAKVLTLLDWPWPGWIDSAVLFVCAATVITGVGCMLHLILAECFARPRRRKSPALAAEDDGRDVLLK